MVALRLLIGCAVIAIGVADARAVERKYETAMGLIVVDVDSGWTGVRQMPDNLNGIGFQVGDGRAMQFLLGAIDEMPPDGTDIVGLRRFADALRRSEANDKIIVSDTLLSISGPQFRGYYYLATNSAAVPAPGDYKHMYTGFILAGSNPLMFTIAWNTGGKPAADRALHAVRTLTLAPR